MTYKMNKQVNDNKSLFFVKINNKSLAKLIKEKERRQHYQYWEGKEHLCQTGKF